MRERERERKKTYCLCTSCECNCNSTTDQGTLPTIPRDYPWLGLQQLEPENYSERCHRSKTFVWGCVCACGYNKCYRAPKVWSWKKKKVVGFYFYPLEVREFEIRAFQVHDISQCLPAKKIICDHMFKTPNLYWNGSITWSKFTPPPSLNFSCLSQPPLSSSLASLKKK